MSRLVESLSASSVFKSYFAARSSAIAIKDDSQVFVAFENVIRATDIHGKNVASILNISAPTATVKDLSLNHDGTLLAAVGSNLVSLFDVKSRQHLESNTASSDVYLGTLPETKTPILMVLWHPASAKHSELVILTETEVVVYDILLSKRVPVLTLRLHDYPELAKLGVLSATFGSITHLGGAITLYLSTKAGEIYAIFPFLYLGANIRSTKAAASRFVCEWDATMEQVDDMLPDSLTFQDERHPFHKQAKFVGAIRLQLEAPMCQEASSTERLVWLPSQDIIDYKLTGPLAYTGPDAKVIQISPNDEFPALAVAFQGTNGATAIQTFAQINPIVKSFEKNAPAPLPPTAPQKSASEPQKVVYKKVAKGFGYQEVLDVTNEENKKSVRALMQTYKEDLLAYKIRASYHLYAKGNFNTLTNLTHDTTAFTHDEAIARSFKLIEKSTFILTRGDQLLIGDTSNIAKLFERRTQDAMEIAYKQKKLQDGTYDSFICIEDIIEGTGGYLVAVSPKAPVICIHFRPKIAIKPLEIMPQSSEATGKPNSDLGLDPLSSLPSEALKMIYAGDETLGGVDSSEDYVKQAFELTSKALKKASKSTQFFLAVQIKLGLQIENLKEQIKVLEEVSAPDSECRAKLDQRIERLVNRQNSLLKRQEDMRSMIIDKFAALKAKQSLPLSDEERSWFSELNSVLKKVSVGDGETPSLESTVVTLTQRVKKIGSAGEVQGEDEAIEESLSKLRLGVSLYKINHTLNQEKKRIGVIKETVQGMMLKVHDA